MALSEGVRDKLLNWKFDSALRILKDSTTRPTEDEQGLIQALCETFGNSGWFEGNLGTIVGAAVDTMLNADQNAGQMPPLELSTVMEATRGFKLDNVFISEQVLGELEEVGTQNTEISGHSPVILPPDIKNALVHHGLIVTQTRGGVHASEEFAEFLKRYEEEAQRERRIQSGEERP